MPSRGSHVYGNMEKKIKSKKRDKRDKRDQQMFALMREANGVRMKKEEEKRKTATQEKLRRAAKAAKAAAAKAVDDGGHAAGVVPTGRDTKLGALATFGQPPDLTSGKCLVAYMAFFGFVIHRCKNHIIWRRLVCNCGTCHHITYGNTCKRVTQQLITSKSPSDQRAFISIQCDIHNMNREACRVYAEAAARAAEK